MPHGSFRRSTPHSYLQENTTLAASTPINVECRVLGWNYMVITHGVITDIHQHSDAHHPGLLGPLTEHATSLDTMSVFGCTAYGLEPLRFQKWENHREKKGAEAI